MESVCGNLRKQRVALFSDNSPMVGWVCHLATKGSMVSAHLIRVLALRLKLNGTCPITPLHIAGEENSMTDIPSRSFGREPKWFCKTNSDLLALHNTLFPLPHQNSWTVFQISYAVGMRVLLYCRRRILLWTSGGDYQRSGNMLGALGSLCCAYGSGPFLTEHLVLSQSLPPQRLCRTRPDRLLRSRQTSPSWKRI